MMSRIVALVQGFYYLLTGLWPLVHMRSFLAVTGPKKDLWLVQTVAVLVLVIGLVLMMAGGRGQVTIEMSLLGLGSALALAAVDAIFVARRVIARIYLLDAFAELLLLGMWDVALLWR